MTFFPFSPAKGTSKHGKMSNLKYFSWPIKKKKIKHKFSRREYPAEEWAQVHTDPPWSQADSKDSYPHLLILFTLWASSSLGLNSQHGISWRKQPLFLRHNICSIPSLAENKWSATRNPASPRSLHRSQICVLFEWLSTSASQMKQGSRSSTFKVAVCMSDYTDGFHCCAFPPWQGRKLEVFWVIKCTCRNNQIHP